MPRSGAKEHPSSGNGAVLNRHSVPDHIRLSGNLPLHADRKGMYI